MEEDGSPFDFTLDEHLIVDRSEEAWPTSQAELEDLWRKRVKSNVLSALLSDDTFEEAKENLSERYRAQLSQILKNENKNMFQQKVMIIRTVKKENLNV